MSTTSEALAQLANQKSALKVIANRYLPNDEKLDDNCTLQDIIDVMENYDEATYMNAFLNSIEVFPDKDYSINDTEGHIKGLRDYAFYKNTAINSIFLPKVTTSISELTGGVFHIVDDCSNLETLVIGANAVYLGQATALSGLASLNKFILNKAMECNLRYNTTIFLYNCPSLKIVCMPKCATFFQNNSLSFGGTTYIDALLIKGGTITNRNTFNILRASAMIITDQETVATCAASEFASQFANYSTVLYVPSALLTSYQSATNWSAVNNIRPIQDIESHINSLRELGVDFSWTPYANKKWENNQLVTDSTIGEEVDS